MAKKKPAKKATDRRELVCAGESPQKFWTIHLEGCSHTVTSGRIGLMVRTQSRNFGSEEAARKSFDKLIAEKVKIGYVDDESGAAAIFLQSHQAAQERERLYYGWSTEADFSRKTGIHPAILSSVETKDGALVRLKGHGSGKRINLTCHARILEDGPIWDCMCAGSDLVVSQRLKDFLEKRTGSDLAFLPTCLKDEEGRKTIDGYYALGFQKVVKAISNYSDLDQKMVLTSGHVAMVVCDKEDDHWSRFAIDAELAEEMIAAGFTGLGFKNPFTDKKPGWSGKTPRAFPEEEMMERYHRDRPTLLIEKTATSVKSIQDGWTALLKEAAVIEPADVWENLEGLDVEEDLERQAEWLGALLKSEPPPKSIRAFWFGIFERSTGKNLEGLATLYACGSERYDKDKRYDFDWAVNPRWFPDGRYTQSATLDAISREANQTKSSELREALFFLTHGYAALLVRFAVGAIPTETLACLGRKKRPLAVGFDSGDGLFVGSVSQSGWKKK